MDKKEILDKALEMAKERGWKNTSVRELSKAIGYSTIKIYSEFESKENLLLEIQRNGFEQLKLAYLNAIKSLPSDKDKLVAITIEHYNFSKKNKALYDLMFQIDGAPCSLPSRAILENTSEPIRHILTNIAGKLDKSLFFHWWAIAHGFVNITHSEKVSEEEALEMLNSIMSNFIKGITP